MKSLLPVGASCELEHIDPSSTPGFTSQKKAAEKQLARNAKRLADYQEKLFAESKFGGQRRVLLVLQGMDTAGKGGILRHVIGGVDPQGVQIHSFKAPTVEEKSHDFLWRIRRQLPVAGNIGVFDRSHYEDVLIALVRNLATPAVIDERYDSIVAFENELTAHGTTIIKVMLHISVDEQKKRLAERLDRDDKHWKYNPGDVDERMLWTDYQRAYEIALQRTSTATAPWYVVPANKKWFARLAVQRLLLDAFEALDPQWPSVDYDVEAERARLAAS
ncbi:MAG: polyphosphate kinase 2 family protein [Rhodoglobus sp.]